MAIVHVVIDPQTPRHNSVTQHVFKGGIAYAYYVYVQLLQKYMHTWIIYIKVCTPEFYMVRGMVVATTDYQVYTRRDSMMTGSHDFKKPPTLREVRVLKIILCYHNNNVHVYKMYLVDVA